MKFSLRQLKTVLLISLVLLMAAPLPASAGFVSSKEGIKYQTESGDYVTGLQKINKNLYLFGKDGLMKKGLQKVGGNYYFFDTKTGVLRYGWISSGGKKYFADRKTGVLYRSRKVGQYYFGADCALAAGKAGAEKTAEKTGWVTVGKRTYYYTASHKKATGLCRIGSKIYIFGKLGVLKRSRFVSVNGKTYYARDDGSMVQGMFFAVGTEKYYAKRDGTIAAGMVKISGVLYYFRENGTLSGRTKITLNGASYIIRKTGKAAVNCWIRYRKNYYWCDADGKIATNRWIGDEYYVGEDGVRIKMHRPGPGPAVVNGRTVVYDESGKLLVSRWYTASDGKQYYLGADGGALTGLQIIGGYKYYFGADGVLQRDNVIYAGGYCYYTSPKDGHIVSVGTMSGAAIAEYAKQFVGNPYVYGGTSLTNGTDCSGFTMSVFAHFGIRILRVAVDQMNGASGYYETIGYAKGFRVSDANLQPGDLVFYGYGNYASHVAMYIGNGMVVHAANSRVGIIISSIDYVNSRLHNMNRRYWAG